MSRLLPSIGMSGTWVTVNPVDLIVLSDVIYTCRAVRSISDFLAQDIDPLAKVYQPLGLSEAQYRQDYLDNAYIVSLQASDESWIYVPFTFIEKYPNGTGTIYNKSSLVVSLPGLPINQNYDLLSDRISEVVSDILGVDTDIKLVTIGDEYLVTPDDHTVNLALRQGNVSAFSSKHAQIRALEHENQRLQDLLEKLALCLNGYCRTGEGITLPTFNPDTPGHSRKIDAADIYYDVNRRPDNGIDLFLYGEQRKTRIRAAVPIAPIENRSELFTPVPTSVDQGKLPNIMTPTLPNEYFTVSSGNFFIFGEEDEGSIYYPSRKDEKLVTHRTPNTLMDMILLSRYEVSNRGHNGFELFLKSTNRVLR